MKTDVLNVDQSKELEGCLLARWRGQTLPNYTGGHLGGETYTVSIPYPAVSGEMDDGTYLQGALEVSIIHTTPRSDQAGVVLRVRQVGGFDGEYPASHQTPDGCEIHIANSKAGEFLVRALRAVLAAVPQ